MRKNTNSYDLQDKKFPLCKNKQKQNKKSKKKHPRKYIKKEASFQTEHIFKEIFKCFQS